MTEQRSALDNALDLLVYAPVGFALTAAEEIPKLAAKGRAQVQGQITIARMVGQFAFAQGRKEIEKRFGVAPPPPAPAPAREPKRASSAQSNGVDSGHGADNGSYERLSGRRQSAEKRDTADSGSSRGGAAVIDVDFGSSARPESPATSPTETEQASPDGPETPVQPASTADAESPGTAQTEERPRPEADGLAIPGYDSLSASQVVQRLAGLSQGELAAVGEYEAAHRGRRTILTRVGQLKG